MTEPTLTEISMAGKILDEQGFTCDKCGKEFFEGGYIGPVDREDRISCDPFQAFDYICGGCENGK